MIYSKWPRLIGIFLLWGIVSHAHSDPIVIGGTISSDTELVADQAYDVTSDIVINSGVRLTVPEGATLSFASNTQLQVNGELVIAGNSGNPVILTSISSTPTAGDWDGIVVPSGGTATIDSAEISYTYNGVYYQSGSTGSVVNSVVSNSTYGIHISGGATVGDISGNTIQSCEYGIYIYSGAATISVLSGNTIQNNSQYGIYFYNATGTIVTNGVIDNTITENDIGLGFNSSGVSPSVSGNSITDNSYNIYLYGSSSHASRNPTPVLTGNSIYGGGNYNLIAFYYADAYNITIDASGNWWGSREPNDIAAGIYDSADSNIPSAPTVDFSGYLDAEDGNPVSTLPTLVGSVSGTIAAGEYEVLGALMVPAGQTLTIPEGSTLSFTTGSSIEVYGELIIAGSAGNPVVLTSISSTPVAGDWDGIVVSSGGAATIDHAEIGYAQYGIQIQDDATVGDISGNTIHDCYHGIYIDGNPTINVLSDNTIQNNSQYGIYFHYATGTVVTNGIINNTITGNYIGLGFEGSGVSPSVSGNSITGNSSYNIYLFGGYSDASDNPTPVLTGNSIHGGGSYNLYAYYYANGPSITIDASGNWWGSREPNDIAAGIYDSADEYSIYAPTVDFSGYLDAEDGDPASTTDALSGAVSGTIAAGEYEVLGALVVPAGQTLTIPEGSTLSFTTGSSLQVDGELVIAGSAGDPVILTSISSTSVAGDWDGIVVSSGGTATIDHAEISYAQNGIQILDGATVGDVSGNNIHDCDYGIYIDGATTISVLSDNTIQNNSQHGIYFYYATGTVVTNGIINNTITDNDTGLGFYRSGVSPSVSGNSITDNSSYNVYLYGSSSNSSLNPTPVLTGNSIHSGANYNLYTYSYADGSSITIDATGNWWGDTDHKIIATGIYDYIDDNNVLTPTVDFSGYLDAEGGNPSDTIAGSVGDATILESGKTYLVLNTLTVPSGETLTIPSGVRLTFWDSSHGLTVDGTLNIQGTSESPVIFTSTSIDPAAGGWAGITLNSGGSLDMTHGQLLYAETAISATSTNSLSVANSVIHSYSDHGVVLNSVPAGTLSNNLIQSSGYSATGIHINTSTVAVTDNRVHGNLYGVYLIGAGSPTLSGNVLSDNRHGVYLAGSGNDATNPTPTLTGNDINGNLDSQLTIDSYGSSTGITINATGNWWGTSTPEIGSEIIITDGAPESVIDISGALGSSQHIALSAALSVINQYFSPNEDNSQDNAEISATLNTATTWTLGIYDDTALIYTASSSGTTINEQWGGTNDSAQPQPDGYYTVKLFAGDAQSGELLASSWIRLDNTAPIGEITSPENDTEFTFANVFNVLGSATDAYFDTYTLDYRRDGDTVWTPLKENEATPISNGLLGQWHIGSLDGSATPPPDGDYSIRLMVNDRAGNQTVYTTHPITLNLIGITDVSRTILNSSSGDGVGQTTLAPLSGEELEVAFTITSGATVELNITPEQGGGAIRTISQTFATAGSYSLTWDGKDAGGDYVMEDAYEYTLTATAGDSTASYDPGTVTVPGFSNALDTTMNSASNDYYQGYYSLNQAGRVTVHINGPEYYYLANQRALPEGDGTLLWDGRDASGAPVYGSYQTGATAIGLATNSVIVEGIRPKLSGAAPYIEIKADPYRISHSYDQISQISYQLDQDAYITFKLLPAGIYDVGDSRAITLVDNELTDANDGNGDPQIHVVQWKGSTDADPAAILVDSEGVGMFWIEATSVASGKSTVYRGSLQMYK